MCSYYVDSYKNIMSLYAVRCGNCSKLAVCQ